MALTKDDLRAVGSVVREEMKQLVSKEDLASTEKRLRTDLASKENLASVKDELGAVEGRLTKKIEEEAEHIAQITIREFGRVHRRTEALARHVGYAFEPEANEGD